MNTTPFRHTICDMQYAIRMTLSLIQVAELSSLLTSQLVNSDWERDWENWTEPHACSERAQFDKISLLWACTRHRIGATMKECVVSWLSKGRPLAVRTESNYSWWPVQQQHSPCARHSYGLNPCPQSWVFASLSVKTPYSDSLATSGFSSGAPRTWKGSWCYFFFPLLGPALPFAPFAPFPPFFWVFPVLIMVSSASFFVLLFLPLLVVVLVVTPPLVTRLLSSACIFSSSSSSDIVWRRRP